MRKVTLVFILVLALAPAYSLMAQVSGKVAAGKDTLNVSRDSLILLIRIKDSLLQLIRHDSTNMSNLIIGLEYNRDSLNAALNQSIYLQKLDSADRMRRYLSYRDYNRRTRHELYSPIGIIDKDSIRSSMKEIVDLVFEDTSYTPRPHVLKTSMYRLVHHLGNDSIYFRIVNTKLDTIPFVLKKNRIDSTAFFVMNSKSDSAKVFIRSLDKNTMAIWVGDDLDLKHLLKKQASPPTIGINWQDPNKMRIARRTVPVQAPKLWSMKSEFGLTVNQGAFSHWAKGGSNNISLTTEVKSWANYAKGNIKWENYFNFVYGVYKAELTGIRKNQDRIRLESNLSHFAITNFYYTLGGNFQTQGFKGYAYPNDSVPVVKLLSPADLNINLGITYKPNPKLTVTVSPIGSQLTFVMDTMLINQTKFGLKPGKRMMAQLGASASVKHSMVVFKTVNVDNDLKLFSNYLDEPEKINFDWLLNIGLRINRFMNLSVKANLVYNNKVLVPIYEIRDGIKVKTGEGKRVQFMETFGLTFRYIL